MIAVIKQELAAFFYGFTRKYAKRLRTARARASYAEAKQEEYLTRVAVLADQNRALALLLEDERRKARDIVSFTAARVAERKVRDWDKVVSLGEDAIAADLITKAKRRGAKTPKELNTARNMRAAATRAMARWKEAKKEFDKKYPPCE